MGSLSEYSQEDQDRINGIAVTPKEVRDALAGLVGLVQLVGGNTKDIPPNVRRYLLTNHRMIEAQRVLGLLERS